MSTFLQHAQWRYATKKFDASRKVAQADIDNLKQAIQLAASSYGLQPYKVLVIEDAAIKAQLQPAAWGQSQLVDASHVFVFAQEVDLNEGHIDAYFDNMIQTRGLKAEDVQGYADFMKSKILAMPNEARNVWTARQCYIALGNLLHAAAELHIDTTPMEGFEPEKFNEILGLPAMGLSAVVVATVGYRHADDATQHYPKVRKSEKDLFIQL